MATEAGRLEESGAARRVQLDALVLAAGAGIRFGGGKLTAPWRGGVLLDGALTAAFAAPTRSVSVVWGMDRAVAAAAARFAEAKGEQARLRLVEAVRCAAGLSDSLKAGIESLPADCAGAFVFLGDMPRVPGGVAPALVSALKDGAAAAAPTFLGRRGHPVLFARALFPRLLALSGDRGAGDLLKDLGRDVVLVDASDDGVLYDVDRPDDLIEMAP